MDGGRKGTLHQNPVTPFFVWFLPYSDMDTCLKTHATQTPGLAPAVTPQVRIPPDAQSQVIGDMIDPAKTEDSFH